LWQTRGPEENSATPKKRSTEAQADLTNFEWLDQHGGLKNMSSGRSNKLTAQIGEYLVCAELGKRTLIATPFAGNVPTFDVLRPMNFAAQFRFR